jgi:hypothetical protein
MVSAWCRRWPHRPRSAAARLFGCPRRRRPRGGWRRADARRASHIVARQVHTGCWEYLLDEAISPIPRILGRRRTDLVGELIGIGSLQLERRRGQGRARQHDRRSTCSAVLDDLRKFGRVKAGAAVVGMSRPRSTTG